MLEPINKKLIVKEILEEAIEKNGVRFYVSEDRDKKIIKDRK